MTDHADSDELHRPDAMPLAGARFAAIIVPLIIGGAVIAAGIVLWEAYARKEAAAELSRTEVMVRGELRAAYGFLHSGQPREALLRAASAGEMLKGRLRSRWHREYLELRTARDLIEAKGLLMLGGPEITRAEKVLETALARLTQTGGPYWQAGILLRARTRFAAGRVKEAAGDLDLLLERNRNYASAYYWRSHARRAAGDASGAAADEARARSLGAWPPMELMAGE